MTIDHDAANHRFVARTDGGDAHLEYARPNDRTLDLRHTFVSPRLRGQGVGEALVRAALDHAREQGSRVIPSCPFVHQWLEEHPEEKDLVGS